MSNMCAKLKAKLTTNTSLYTKICLKKLGLDRKD